MGEYRAMLYVVKQDRTELVPKMRENGYAMHAPIMKEQSGKTTTDGEGASPIDPMNHNEGVEGT